MQVLVSAESSKAKINDLAVAAADELIQKACALEPLWMFDEDKETETLNVPEYQRRFASLGSTLEEIIKLIAGGGEPLELSDGLAANHAKFQGKEGGDKPPMIFPVGNGQASLQTEASRATGVVLMQPLNIVDLFMDIVSFLTHP